MKKYVMVGLVLTIFVFAALCNNSLLANAKDLYKNDSGVASMDKVTEVRASHILVDTKEEAETLRQEILAGKDFAAVAKESSKCPSGSNGGDLGYFGRGMMVPEFEQAAFSLPAGEVSEPVKTQFGWHLIKVTAQR